MIVESDADRAGGSEVVAVTFDTFDDILTSNFTNNGFSDLNIAPNFSVGGFAFEPDPVVDPINPVPLPAGMWLLVSALGLLALRRNA